MRGKPKKILSISERETLAGEKQDLGGQLKSARGKEWGDSSRMDTGVMAQQMNVIDKALHDGVAPVVKGVKKDGMAQRSKDLLTSIREGMPTRYEMDNPHLCPGAVHKHLKWSAKNAANITEYRRIMKTLEPDDPTTYDLEKYRRDR